MLGKANSPTARLLRSSRLFSLPPQLPKPSLDVGTPSGDPSLIRGSDSATLPYPVNQAIATPQSSQARGDWGLKRPLPLRTTAQSSNTTLRITNVDTIEHITDFESAADHTKTLEKWQEIGLPVTQHARRKTVSDQRGGILPNVFESNIDNTSKSPNEATGRKSQSEAHQRWKYEGPSISGMTAGAFQEYVATIGKHRKTQFLSYLREHTRQAEMKAERDRIRDEGQVLPPDFHDTFTISEEFFQDKLKRMRDDMIDKDGNAKLDAELSERMREFFDLPQASKEFSMSQLADPDEDEPPIEDPSTTHPSAGFSYLRTQAHIPNHPLFGPQRNNPVVRIRSLQVRSQNPGTGRLGVAGIVAECKNNLESFKLRSDVTVHGGPKAWAEVQQVSVNPRGRIDVALKPPDPDAMAIKEGRVPQRLEVPTPPYKKNAGVKPLDVRATGQRGRSRWYGGKGENDSAAKVKILLDQHRERKGLQAEDDVFKPERKE